jgi:hypothetical protein
MSVELGPVKSILRDGCLQLPLHKCSCRLAGLYCGGRHVWRWYVSRSGMFLEIYVPPIWRHMTPHTIAWEEVTKCYISGHFPAAQRLVAASYLRPAEIELYVHGRSRDEISGAVSSLAQWLCYRGLPGDLVGLIGHYTAAAWCHGSLFFARRKMNRVVMFANDETLLVVNKQGDLREDRRRVRCARMYDVYRRRYGSY